jgi:hypothetical protein
MMPGDAVLPVPYLKRQDTPSILPYTQRRCDGRVSTPIPPAHDVFDFDLKTSSSCVSDTSSTGCELDEDGRLIVETPFWFGREKKEHIRLVADIYIDMLNIETKPPSKRSRRPEFFVGRIKRTRVVPMGNSDWDIPMTDFLPHDDNDIEPFYTFDEVCVYQRDMVPEGYNMTRVRTIYVLTYWDDDGLPVHMIEIRKKSRRYRKIRCCRRKDTRCWIYCQPVFMRDEYEYAVSHKSHEVGYCCRSPFLSYNKSHPSCQGEQDECRPEIKQGGAGGAPLDCCVDPYAHVQLKSQSVKIGSPPLVSSTNNNKSFDHSNGLQFDLDNEFSSDSAPSTPESLSRQSSAVTVDDVSDTDSDSDSDYDDDDDENDDDDDDDEIDAFHDDHYDDDIFSLPNRPGRSYDQNDEAYDNFDGDDAHFGVTFSSTTTHTTAHANGMMFSSSSSSITITSSRKSKSKPKSKSALSTSLEDDLQTQLAMLNGCGAGSGSSADGMFGFGLGGFAL